MPWATGSAHVCLHDKIHRVRVVSCRVVFRVLFRVQRNRTLLVASHCSTRCMVSWPVCTRREREKIQLDMIQSMRRTGGKRKKGKKKKKRKTGKWRDIKKKKPMETKQQSRNQTCHQLICPVVSLCLAPLLSSPKNYVADSNI